MPERTTVGLTGGFARALLARRDRGLPDDVLHETRRSLLNVLGTVIGASRSSEVEAVVGLVAADGVPEAAVPGRGDRLGRHGAALAIGLAGHRDDFDDTHPPSLIHASASTFAAVYPLAVRGGAEARSVLEAMALGIESQLRLGMVMTPSHYDIGWHITGTCGVVGAGVAAGLLMDSGAADLTATIGLAASFFLGHREAFGTPVKPFHSGKAAANGILAAELARLGIGDDAVDLDADGGYFTVLADAWTPTYLEPDHVTGGWVLLENTYKAYPCGVVAHPAIEAAIALHRDVGRAGARDVAAVGVRCHPLVVELMGRPVATTGLEAKFCAVHGVAVGLLDGRGGLVEFSDERATDPEVDALRRRTTLHPDPAVPLEAATVTVSRTDGSGLEWTVDAVAGSRGRPLTDDMLRAKFGSLVEPVLPGRSDELADAVLDLGRGTGFADFVKVLHR
jgi:2-methylcitrate dehydratase PrpD